MHMRRKRLAGDETGLAARERHDLRAGDLHRGTRYVNRVAAGRAAQGVVSAAMRILVSGAGIAGPTLAWWLLRDGHEVTIVERAPRARSGGYMVDFWGAGFAVAERMGLAPELKRRGYEIGEVRIVDARGRRCGGFHAAIFGKVLAGRYTSIARGDLATALFASIAGRVDVRFGDGIRAIDEDANAVQVEFEHARPECFDLVIGADGLHSAVRHCVFGPQECFETSLGYTVAAFEVAGYEPRDESTYVGYGSPGQQVARISMRADRTVFLIVFAHELPRGEIAGDAQARRILHEAFDDGGWECPRIMQAMDRCPEIYFDRVSQIRMPAWTRGRVALVGDAASCPSLLAGEGSSLAMTQARVLAGELHAAGGDHRVAFPAYEQRLRAFIQGKQDAARKFAATFAPRTAFGVKMRNLLSRTLDVPLLARWMVRRMLVDRVVVPDYDVD